MKIELSWDLTSTPDEVYEDAINPEYQDDKCKAAGAITFSSKVEETGQGHTSTVQRLMSSGDVPELVKKVVGDKVDVLETIAWGPKQADGSRKGDLTVHMKGQPISMKGFTYIKPNGTGSTVGVDAELKAKIPVIGGKIEKMGSPEIIKAIKAEEATAHEWDARRHA